MDIDGLREILARNYEALGWQLQNLETIASPGFDEKLLRGMIVCPCGGKEYFNMVLDHRHPCEDTRALATEILTHTASISHLQADVDNGSLPAMDVEKHAFKGALL